MIHGFLTVCGGVSTPPPHIVQGSTAYSCIMIQQVGFSLEFLDCLEHCAGMWQHGRSWSGPTASLTSLGSTLDCWGLHPYCMHTPHKWPPLGHPMDLGARTPVGAVHPQDNRREEEPPGSLGSKLRAVWAGNPRVSGASAHRDLYVLLPLALSSSCLSLA